MQSSAALSPPAPVLSEASADVLTSAFDDFDREVYCILGMSIDAIDMRQALTRIDAAVAEAKPFLLATTNVNFLVTSLRNLVFRETILMSDLCVVDGMPVVWIARLLGVPVRQRVAGSDVFDALKMRRASPPPLRTFWFGASEEVAAAASERINQRAGGVSCVGWICPGFGPLEELCQDRFIDKINSSGADFLVAALGANKGQLWLRLNHRRIRIPVRAHLGAVINFEAGAVKRAPKPLREWGLEWAWRIKEEPHLFMRYWRDGCTLLRLLMTNVLPLAVFARWLRSRARRQKLPFAISATDNDDAVTIRIDGYATADRVAEAIGNFRLAVANKKLTTIDLAGTRALDARFLGALLMLRKQLRENGCDLAFIGTCPHIKRLFWLHGLDDLLTPRQASP